VEKKNDLVERLFEFAVRVIVKIKKGRDKREVLQNTFIM